MTYICNISASDKKSPPLPLNDKNMPAWDQMTSSDQNRPPLSENDTNMTDYKQMSGRKHKSVKLTSYNVAEELIFRYYF